MPAQETEQARHIEVTGVVQGVGFRPFVHALATELCLTGTVRNTSSSVVIDVVGSHESLDLFVERLRNEAPALARIDTLTESTIALESNTQGFVIVPSTGAAGARTLISPDAAVCADCVAELFDPHDRRFGHPFITCTNCGPRLSIIADLPYDRPNTTMAPFGMCDQCRVEYEDPTDRRYHAQPIGCHDCGPQLSFLPGLSGEVGSEGSDPIGQAAAVFEAGGIVAVKGIGGYHLVCDATNTDAVADLRRRKHRPDKPLAVMVRDVAAAEAFVRLNEAERRELASPAAPIVLARAHVDGSSARLPALVAPGSPLLGVMLAYAPVHHLLLEQLARPLIVTSANPPGAPLARNRLGLDAIAHLYDAILDHDREIRVPVDDSVVRLIDDEVVPIRRARGYAPIPIPMPEGDRSVLAVGGELKNTFCLSTGDRAWVSQHIGDMQNVETLNAFDAMVKEFSTMYQVEPDVIAVDAHPGYLSSKWARRSAQVPIVEVQHHHAHVAAVMAEHGLDPHVPVIGFTFDGTGYGADGTIWGGELLVADATSFERRRHVRRIQLPGGDAAVQNPHRVALAHLYAAGIEWSDDLAPVQQLSDGEQALLAQQLERNVACVPTTSMGRLFDAVASLLDVRHRISYEAQAAIELEALAASSTTPRGDRPRYLFQDEAEGWDPGPMLAQMIDDRRSGRPGADIAFDFHLAVAIMVAAAARQIAASDGLGTVVLSGGVFQNGLLHSLCLQKLGNEFDVYTHRLVPANDGGLSLGQAFIAAHVL